MSSRKGGTAECQSAGSAPPPIPLGQALMESFRALGGGERFELAPQRGIRGRRRMQALEERPDVEPGAAHHHR